MPETMLGLTLPDVERLSDRVVVVRGLNPGPFTGPGTNTYLVGTERPILLDTGAGVKAYIGLLERALREHFQLDAPGDVVVTHVHSDHLGGAPDVLERFGPRPVSKRPWPGRDERVGVDITPIGHRDTIRVIGATLRAIHTPGHAEDHLCFYLDEEKALFTGDVILGAGTTVIPLDGGDMGDYLETLERLLDLDLERIYPGHGPTILEPRRKVQEYLDHRLEREREILAAIEVGAVTVERMVERIYAAYPRKLHAAAGQSVTSHLHKLERERRVVRRIDGGGEEHWSLV